MVTIHTAQNCQKCHVTIRALKKRNIDYCEVHLDDNPEVRDQLQAQGFTTLPVVVTSDGDAWQGYNPDKIKTLARKAA